MRYRTEIFVPDDRYVCLQLPDYLPSGRAVVTIHIEGADPHSRDVMGGDEADRHDVEWWEEFDEEGLRPD